MSQQPTPTPPATPPSAYRRDIEAWLGRLLTISVLIAAFTTAFGATLYITHHGKEPINLSSYHPQPNELTSPPHIIHNAAQLNPEAILQLGVLLLIATPVARVFFSLILFAIARDKLYVAITVVVLTTLAIGLFSDIL
jgi:uncharacterized membrane protein